MYPSPRRFRSVPAVARQACANHLRSAVASGTVVEALRRHVGDGLGLHLVDLSNARKLSIRQVESQSSETELRYALDVCSRRCGRTASDVCGAHAELPTQPTQQ